MTQFVPKQWQHMREWLGSPLGQAFLKEESLQVEKLSQKIFGLHLLLLGEPQFGAGVLNNPISHRIWVHPKIIPDEILSAILARQDKLPILSDEMDLIYLAHCLEFLPNPHEVLRETYRALRPEGHVIISVFNPLSFWNLWRWLLHFIKPVPWDGRLLSMMRLKDWLTLLGFDVVDTKRFFFRLPLNYPAYLKRFAWVERLGQFCFPLGGAGCIVLAKKRVLTLTPIKSTFKTPKPVLAPGLIEPVTRSK